MKFYLMFSPFVFSQHLMAGILFILFNILLGKFARVSKLIEYTRVSSFWRMGTLHCCRPPWTLKGLNSTSQLSLSLECHLTSNTWKLIDKLSYYELNIAPYKDLKMIFKILAVLFSYFQMSTISTNLIVWGWEWDVKVEAKVFQMSWLW